MFLKKSLTQGGQHKNANTRKSKSLSKKITVSPEPLMSNLVWNAFSTVHRGITSCLTHWQSFRGPAPYVKKATWGSGGAPEDVPPTGYISRLGFEQCIRDALLSPQCGTWIIFTPPGCGKTTAVRRISNLLIRDRETAIGGILYLDNYQDIHDYTRLEPWLLREIGCLRALNNLDKEHRTFEKAIQTVYTPNQRLLVIFDHFRHVVPHRDLGYFLETLTAQSRRTRAFCSMICLDHSRDIDIILRKTSIAPECLQFVSHTPRADLGWTAQEVDALANRMDWGATICPLVKGRAIVGAKSARIAPPLLSSVAAAPMFHSMYPEMITMKTNQYKSDWGPI